MSKNPSVSEALLVTHGDTENSSSHLCPSVYTSLLTENVVFSQKFWKQYSLAILSYLKTDFGVFINDKLYLM